MLFILTVLLILTGVVLFVSDKHNKNKHKVRKQLPVDEI
jgi:hypothetical protein